MNAATLDRYVKTTCPLTWLKQHGDTKKVCVPISHGAQDSRNDLRPLWSEESLGTPLVHPIRFSFSKSYFVTLPSREKWTNWRESSSKVKGSTRAEYTLVDFGLSIRLHRMGHHYDNRSIIDFGRYRGSFLEQMDISIFKDKEVICTLQVQIQEGLGQLQNSTFANGWYTMLGLLNSGILGKKLLKS